MTFSDRLSARGRGLARELIQRAEAEAIRRGCFAAYLTTFSFQARGLYEKLGYRVVGQLDDYPPGSTYYWMRKEFDSAPAGRGFGGVPQSPSLTGSAGDTDV